MLLISPSTYACCFYHHLLRPVRVAYITIYLCVLLLSPSAEACACCLYHHLLMHVAFITIYLCMLLISPSTYVCCLYHILLSRFLFALPKPLSCAVFISRMIGVCCNVCVCVFQMLQSCPPGIAQSVTTDTGISWITRIVLVYYGNPRPSVIGTYSAEDSPACRPIPYEDPRGIQNAYQMAIVLSAADATQPKEHECVVVNSVGRLTLKGQFRDVSKYILWEMIK